MEGFNKVEIVHANKPFIKQACDLCTECLSVQKWLHPTLVQGRLISWITIFASVIIFIFGMIFQFITDSSVALATSLDSLLDILTAVLLLWRFWGISGKDEARLKSREARAQALVGLSFLILAVLIMFDALIHLEEHEKVTHKQLLINYNIVLSVVLFILGALQLHVGRKLSSEALWSDGVNTLLGSVLTISTVINTYIIKANKNVWYLDGVLAIVIAVILCLYGSFLLMRYPWWSRVFWFPEQSFEPLEHDKVNDLNSPNSDKSRDIELS